MTHICFAQAFAHSRTQQTHHTIFQTQWKLCQTKMLLGEANPLKWSTTTNTIFGWNSSKQVTWRSCEFGCVWLRDFGSQFIIMNEPNVVYSLSATALIAHNAIGDSRNRYSHWNALSSIWSARDSHHFISIEQTLCNINVELLELRSWHLPPIIRNEKGKKNETQRRKHVQNMFMSWRGLWKAEGSGRETPIFFIARNLRCSLCAYDVRLKNETNAGNIKIYVKVRKYLL